MKEQTWVDALILSGGGDIDPSKLSSYTNYPSDQKGTHYLYHGAGREERKSHPQGIGRRKYTELNELRASRYF